MEKNMATFFPHSLMIFLLREYGSADRSVLLNEFVIKSNIGNDDKIKTIKLKEILTRFELDGYLTWTASKEDENKLFKSEAIYKEDSILYDENPLVNYHINATLTIKGIDYAINLLRNKEEFESTILTNKFSRRNIIATLLFTVIITGIQIDSCHRETLRDNREQHRLDLDSIEQARRFEDHSRFYTLPGKKTKYNLKDSSKDSASLTK